MTPAQKSALARIHKNRADAWEVHTRTLDALLSRGYLVREGDGFTITKKGLRIVEGRAGGSLQQVKKKDLRAHLKSRKPAKKKRDRATTAKEKKEHLEGLRTHHEKADQDRRRSLQRILGTSGSAGAVKVSKASGEPFTADDVAAFVAAGWKVTAAASVSARPGASGIKGVLFREGDWTFHNPSELGPHGTARALVLVGQVDTATVDDLAADGYDVAAAPKKLREAPVRNPGPSVQEKAYKALKATTAKGVALRVEELAERIKAPIAAAADALERLQGMGLAYVYGRDLFGTCWLAGAPQRGLFDNPSSEATKAVKKAKAWYQDDALITDPVVIGWKPPKSAIHVGQIVAIEYLSDKFDGTKRIYRHEATKERNLLVSLDGSTLIIDPAFKITKRGIEG